MAETDLELQYAIACKLIGNNWYNMVALILLFSEISSDKMSWSLQEYNKSLPKEAYGVPK